MRERTAAALTSNDACDLAKTLIAACGLADRVQVDADSARTSIGISGPDQFGMMGTTSWRTIHLDVPVAPVAVAIAVARHLFGEFYARDAEIVERRGEMPFVLALALEASS